MHFRKLMIKLKCLIYYLHHRYCLCIYTSHYSNPCSFIKLWNTIFLPFSHQMKIFFLCIFFQMSTYVCVFSHNTGLVWLTFHMISATGTHTPPTSSAHCSRLARLQIVQISDTHQFFTWLFFYLSKVTCCTSHLLENRVKISICGCILYFYLEFYLYFWCL